MLSKVTVFFTTSWWVMKAAGITLIQKQSSEHGMASHNIAKEKEAKNKALSPVDHGNCLLGC
jgi:hypothetical protein